MSEVPLYQDGHHFAQKVVALHLLTRRMSCGDSHMAGGYTVSRGLGGDGEGGNGGITN